MAAIDAAAVKKLREMTGAGLMDCKRALVETEGDSDKAAQLLREKGIASAGKKADREASEGFVGVYISEDGKRAAMVEVNCETDFVARNDAFVKLGNDLAKAAVEGNATDIASLMTQPIDGGATAEESVKSAMATLGENIVPARLVRFEGQGVVGSYVHTDGKQAALVEVAGNDAVGQQVARDIAMQAVALKAPHLTREDVAAELVEAEKHVYREQAKGEGKPDAMLDKIAEGRLGKFYSQIVLMEQPFIKDSTGKQTTAQMVKAAGDNLRVVRFARIKIGEN